MNRASLIQSELNRCIANATSREKLLPLVLANAAKRQNLCLPETEIQCLTTAILNAEGDVVHLDLDPPCALGETEKEIESTVLRLFSELEESIEEIGGNLADAVSKVVPDVVSKMAEIIGDHISEHAIEHTRQLQKAHSDRAETVECLWGVAIEQLDLLRHFVLEWSCTAIAHRKGAYSNSNTAFALSRLVARSYEVVGEIVTLARAGYADGALARWRSLHEISVIAMFLARRSDRCAQMYISHHCIEELRRLEVDRESGTSRTSSTSHDRYTRDLGKQKIAMIKQFGTAFASDYGWASAELGRNRTTFRDLEELVGLETLRRGYQEANNTVHGGALATLTRISLGPGRIDGSEVPPAYGCEVAINYATASLSMLIAELCLETESADLAAMGLVVHNCALKIWNQIKQVQIKNFGNSPRAKILMRRAAQRQSRAKLRITFRR